MNISSVNKYKDPIVGEINTSGLTSAGVSQSGTSSGDSRSAGLKSDYSDSKSVISQKERDFFIKMFPQNSEQLEKHVIFNRSGKLQTADIQKGMIVDGRV